MTVAESVDNLPRTYRGLDALTGTGEPATDLLPCPLVVQYEIAGPGGGAWHLIADRNGCRVHVGAAIDPFTVVRVSTEDWLELWDGRASVWMLIRADRITFTPEDPEVLDLPYLGVLGPAVQSPNDTLWLALHGIPRWRYGYFVSGSLPDFELFRHWGNRTVPNPRMLVGATLACAVILWWLAGIGAAAVGTLATIVFLSSVAVGLAGRAEHDPVTFRWSVISGVVTVRPRAGK